MRKSVLLFVFMTLPQDINFFDIPCVKNKYGAERLAELMIEDDSVNRAKPLYQYNFNNIDSEMFLDLVRYGNPKQFRRIIQQGDFAYWVIHDDITQENFIEKLHALFYKNFVPFFSSAKKDAPSIPLVIHQIWMGETPPEKVLTMLAQWQKLPSHWQYKLWNEKDIEELNLHNKNLYNACTNPAKKADIARLEILYRLGGLYLDVDVELIRIDLLEQLHYYYDFYAGMEMLSGQTPFTIGNAVVASKPHNKFILKLILGLESWIQECEKVYVVDKTKKFAYPWEPVCVATGPGYLSNLLYKSIKEEMPERTIIFPPQFFHIPQDDNPDSLGILRHKFFGSWLDKK